MVIEPMNYFMPSALNIDNIDQTTLEAIRRGKRTSTTRSYWLNGVPKVGNIIKFVNVINIEEPAIVEVVAVKTVPKNISQAFLDQWIMKERWNIDYVIQSRIFEKPKLIQVEFKLVMDGNNEAAS